MSSQIPLSTVTAKFIYDGIRIQEAQYDVQKLVAQLNVHFSEALQAEIAGQRVKIQQRIAKWRITQKLLIPACEARLGEQMACSAEHQVLGIPSEFEKEDRDVLNLGYFTPQELELRGWMASDARARARREAQTLIYLRREKTAHATGVSQNAKMGKQIDDMAARRDRSIARYWAARAALAELGA
ncbi:hypothetical protein DFH07DRAFT_964118 [Mycena maculata]|uniref:Uncharacterized protein n=1 Tax=Mycena maculata TaxID=230809 RepID=A0AAD7IHU6_9AGAR|nr:hypothetical protein DFH07DRAFT_964118 [Mycena maculata]